MFENCKNGTTAVCRKKLYKGRQDSQSSGWYMNSGLEYKAWVVTLQALCKMSHHTPLRSANACNELKMMSTGESVA